MRSRYYADDCLNPRCRDYIHYRYVRLCPSCRLAGGAGSAVAFAIALFIELIRRLL